MDRTVPSSGTPRNMDGIKSIIEWDMDIEIKNTQDIPGKMRLEERMKMQKQMHQLY